MRTAKILCITVLAAVSFFANTNAAEKPAAGYVPESGSAETGAKKKMPVIPYDESLPDVLLIGDSISIGYTPYVAEGLRGVANVTRVKGNCQGTQFGVENIDKWLVHKKPWTVIHFNWGCTTSSAGRTGKTPTTLTIPARRKSMCTEKTWNCW
jgi:acyl-CoA thioesterase-1